MRYKKFVDSQKDDKPWIKGLKRLLNDKNISQKILSEKSGVPEATISDWVNDRAEPKISGFIAIAKAFGVSIDYLWGRNTCKTRSNEEIHRLLGLSDKSISKLQHIAKRKNNDDVANKLAAINLLIENMNNTGLLDDLYYYLLGHFSFESKDGQEKQFAAPVYYEEANGNSKRLLVYAESLSKAYYVAVQEDLVQLKDHLLEERELLKKNKGKGASRE